MKYELGVRLMKGGQFSEAIKALQGAVDDAKRKSKTHMALGECFQQIKQYKLAMTNYEAALEASSQRDLDERKKILYRAGYLSLGLAEKYAASGDNQAKDEFSRAEKYLNELAGLEFGYKDLPKLLDKLAKIGHKG